MILFRLMVIYSAPFNTCTDMSMISRAESPGKPAHSGRLWQLIEQNAQIMTRKNYAYGR